MASFGEGLTQALLGGAAEMGRGIQRRGEADRAASVKQKRETALANIKAANEAAMQTRREQEAERGRQATAEEKRLDRESRAEQSQLDRESRERIAAQKNQDALSQDDDPSLLADEYADERVKEQAGFFETDATSFKDFGGSRAKAREFYRQEFLEGRGGDQTKQSESGMTSKSVVSKPSAIESGYNQVQTRLIDAVRDKNPNATDEQIVAALKNNEKYSKYFD